MSEYETIIVKSNEEYNHVLQITLNRPESLNALNTNMAIELIDIMTKLKGEWNIRALIITATGNRSFCVGADLKERRGMTNKQWKEQHDIFEKACKLIRDFPFPTIAAINGFALGGGLEIALQCDLRIAAESAMIGLPEAKLGIIPGLGGTQMLSRSLPIGVAKQLLYTGETISVKDLSSYGVFNNIVPDEKLANTCLELANTIAQNAPLSLKALKKSVNQGIHKEIDKALEIELKNYYDCANSQDRIEGINSFNEKRKPMWKNK